MKRDSPYLQHIYDAICDIERFIENTDFEAFSENKEKQYAVITQKDIPELKTRIAEVLKEIGKEDKNARK